MKLKTNMHIILSHNFLRTITAFLLCDLLSGHKCPIILWHFKSQTLIKTSCHQTQRHIPEKTEFPATLSRNPRKSPNIFIFRANFLADSAFSLRYNTDTWHFRLWHLSIHKIQFATGRTLHLNKPQRSVTCFSVAFDTILCESDVTPWMYIRVAWASRRCSSSWRPTPTQATPLLPFPLLVQRNKGKVSTDYYFRVCFQCNHL